MSGAPSGPLLCPESGACVQPSPFTRENLGSVGHNQNPSLARERPRLTRGGAGNEADLALQSRCLCMTHPFLLPAC